MNQLITQEWNNMIKKIVFDGHDGVGKSTRIEEMKKLFPGVEFSDRGIFSEATMNFKVEGEDKTSLLKIPPRSIQTWILN